MTYDDMADFHEHMADWCREKAGPEGVTLVGPVDGKPFVPILHGYVRTPQIISEAELEAEWREAMAHDDCLKRMKGLPFPKRRVTMQGPMGEISVGGTQN